MVKFIATIVIILSMTLGAYGQTKYASSSLVIVKLSGITTDHWNKIVSAVHASDGMVSEFYCEQSEVMVIRYYHNFLEKADVSKDVMSKMKAWSHMKVCEIIYVDMSAEDKKC